MTRILIGDDHAAVEQYGTRPPNGGMPAPDAWDAAEPGESLTQG